MQFLVSSHAAVLCAVCYTALCRSIQEQSREVQERLHETPIPMFLAAMPSAQRDHIMQLFTQAVNHYGSAQSPEVRGDIMTKFEITETQFNQLVGHCFSAPVARFNQRTSSASSASKQGDSALQSTSIDRALAPYG